MYYLIVLVQYSHQKDKVKDLKLDFNKSLLLEIVIFNNIYKNYLAKQ